MKAYRALIFAAVAVLGIGHSPVLGQADEHYVRMRLEAPATVQPGSKFDLTVQLTIADGFHIQSDKPAPNYIPTTIAVTGPKGIVAGSPVFPRSELAEAAGEMIPVFGGVISIRVPITIGAAVTGRLSLRVTCRYQACDTGSCFPPDETSAETRLTVGASRANAKPSPGAPPDQAPTGSVTKPQQTVQGPDTSETSTSSEPPQEPVNPVPDGAPEEDHATSGILDGVTMTKITEFVGPEEFTRFLDTGSTDAGSDTGALNRLLTSGNLLLALPLIFLLGLALNLTPCVYPIIPITISYFGGQAGKSGPRPLALAICYVLGMAVTYSTLGVIAGLTGNLFGSQLQNPWVLLSFSVVMFALALSQFDRPDGRPIWEFQLPASMRNRAQSRTGLLGALLMGIMVGVVAAPCIGPAVIALLQWVGSQQDPVMGFTVFFSLSLGLGFPYLFLATASSRVKTLPRAGEWMVGVKHIFGVILIWMGVYYLQTIMALVHPLVPKAALGGTTVLIGLYLLFLDRSGQSSKLFTLSRRGLGLVAILLAVWMLKPAPPEQIQWRAYSDAALKTAIADGRPVLVDFTAAWCAACKELEHKTFSDPRVGRAAQRFIAFRGDMTDFGGSEQQKWQQLYGIKGLPTVVRLEPRH